MKRFRLYSALLGLLVLTGCIPSGSPIKLGVPYRAQERYNYCTAASISMWRLYDGLPERSQTYIFNWMGGQGCTTQFAAADAVSFFTNSGADAYWDNDSSANSDRMAARQITSIDAGIPVMVVVRYDHTGVLNGGKWHEMGASYVWDYVYFHDPDPRYGANVYFAANHWLDQFCPSSQTSCDQIISAAATAAWWNNYLTYRSSVVTYGESRTEGPPVY